MQHSFCGQRSIPITTTMMLMATVVSQYIREWWTFSSHQQKRGAPSSAAQTRFVIKTLWYWIKSCLYHHCCYHCCYTYRSSGRLASQSVIHPPIRPRATRKIRLWPSVRPIWSATTKLGKYLWFPSIPRCSLSDWSEHLIKSWFDSFNLCIERNSLLQALVQNKLLISDPKIVICRNRVTFLPPCPLI